MTLLDLDRVFFCLLPIHHINKVNFPDSFILYHLPFDYYAYGMSDTPVTDNPGSIAHIWVCLFHKLHCEL